MSSGLVTIPGYALVVDLFAKEERGWAGIGIALFGAFGTLTGILLEMLFGPQFFMIISGTGIILIIIVLPILVLIPKHNLSNYSDKSFKDDFKLTSKYLLDLDQYHESNRYIFINLLIIQVFWGASVYIITINTPLLLILLENAGYTVIKPGNALIILGIFGIILAGPIGLIIKSIGKTKTGMIGAISFGLGSFLLAQEFMWNIIGIYLILFIIGGSAVIISVITIALPADLVPATHAGQYMGIFTMASMLLSPVVGFASALIIDVVSDPFTGFQAVFYTQVILQVIVFGLLYILNRQETYEIKIENQNSNFL